MDANNTRFHLLLGKADWARSGAPDDGPIFGESSKLEWDDKRHELRLRAEEFIFRASPSDRRPSQNDRRGAGADAFGNWYWIAESRDEIRVQSSGESSPAHFWSASDAQQSAPARDAVFQPVTSPAPVPARFFGGLAVTEDHYLVVGMRESAGLLVFDLLGGGSPWQVCWPPEIPFEAFDMVPRRGGGVWVLDREHLRFWALDRTLRVITFGQTERMLADATEDIFQPEEGDRRAVPACTFPEGIELVYASPIEARDPVAIEAMEDGSVLILDAPENGPSRLLRYRFLDEDHRRNATFLGETALTFRAFDFALAAGRLYVAAAEGNQAFALDAAGSFAAIREYFPMRRFGGKALVAAGDKVYYDFGDRWLSLVAQPHPRYTSDATLWTHIFDGREPECVWHRLMLDACLPPGTNVEVWSRVAEDEDEIGLATWEPEPRLRRRGNGSELSFVQAPLTARNRGTFELLLQRARGRFIQLQLRLTGDGRLTPGLRALRLYYPRFSYLERYLPAVYRQDSESAFFLDRFLANFEGINTGIEDHIAAVQMLFDVRSAPADTLDWLATWFGVALDPAWDEARRRLFLEHAMEFFQWRGTVRGLKMALRLAFEEKPDAHIFAPPGGKCRCGDRFRIVEKFLTRRTPAVELGDPSAVSAGLSSAPAEGQWKPEHGAAALHARYKAFAGKETFTLTPDREADVEAARIVFAQRELGFVPSDPTEEIAEWQSFVQRAGLAPVPVPEGDKIDAEIARRWREFVASTTSQPHGQQRRMWQHFLIRRYISVLALNQAHSTQWASFEHVAYPIALPNDPELLRDWLEFEAHVLPTLAAAHRFSVLLPVTRVTSTSDEDRRRQLALASRIIDLEKPAHTVFDVKFFWALFRVGEARLGHDSVLGLGGRDPALLPHAVVGQAYLGESLIATGPPPSLAGRIIAGRDRLPRKSRTTQ